jgi:type IV pilus assembly protein PilX
MKSMQLKSIRIPAKQHGMILIMCLVFLVLLTIIGVNAMSSAGLEERMASNTQSQIATFQVVESAIAETVADDTVFVNAVNVVSGVTSTVTIGSHTASTTTTLSGAPQITAGYSIGTFVSYPFSIEASSNNSATGAYAKNTQGVKRLAPGGT